MRALLLMLVLVACSAPAPKGLDPAARGPHPVGSRTLILTDSARGRTLPVEVWYPADESARAAAETGEPISAMVPDAANRAIYESLLASAPEGCATRTVHSARNATPASGTWPLVIASHCHTCTRFAYATIAEHLASRGIAVAAPDHVGNTLFDDQAGTAMGLTKETLDMRVGDVRFVLSTLLDGNATAVDSSLRGRFDADRVGAMGHSFGSMTTGYFAKAEPRLKAIAGLAAPMAGVFDGLEMSDIPKPLLFVLAKEDNSIGSFGNQILQTDFDEAASPAWKIELADAGHFSVTDIARIVPDFDAGCGMGLRQTDMTSFSYAPLPEMLDVTRTWVAALFEAELQEDPAAKAFLANPPARTGVEVAKK